MTDFMISNTEYELVNNNNLEVERRNEIMMDERMEITNNTAEPIEKAAKKRNFLSPLKDQAGLGTVELLMLLVVLVALVAIFKDQMAAFLDTLIGQIFQFDGTIGG